MNDPIERAFECLRETEVPAGPSENLIQMTLRSVDQELRNVATCQRRRRRRYSTAIAAAAVVLFGLTLFTLRYFESRNNQSESVIQQPSATLSTTVASAFIESDQLEAGQTFLLPLRESPVCIDPATWPNDLLTINSSTEL